MPADGSFTSMSQPIPRRSGPCSSSAKPCRLTTRTAFSSMTGIPSSPKTLDQAVRHMGLHVIKTPVRTPVANAICERVIGTLRRECLDFVIPLNARHLYGILKAWVAHYNAGRPHMSLGPGIPQPRPALPVSPPADRHLIPTGQRVVAQAVLGG